jgi:predicted phage terminase large subunit-like protein
MIILSRNSILPHVGRKIKGSQKKHQDYAPLTLPQFIRHFWSILEPNTPYQHNWHIDAVSDHLTAVTKGQIKRLVINIPPGSMKSLLSCVFWCAWQWGELDPSYRWIFASYAGSLSTRDSVKCRRLIQSHEYQQRYGFKFQLQGDQNAKTYFENDRTGFRLSLSVGSSGTGHRAHAVIVDDPHKVTEAESNPIRESAVEWWTTEMSNRGNSKDAAYVVIQQRVHTGDVAGWCIDHGYEKLVIPSEYEGDRHITSIGWSDPRTKDGELLWGDRFDKKYLDSQLEALSSYGYAGQHQQRPSPRGGGMIKLAWFNRFRVPPSYFSRTIISADTALSAKESACPWAFSVWGEYRGNYYLIDLLTKKMEYPEGKRVTRSLCEKYSPNACLIENKSSGGVLIQELKREGFRTPIILIDPTADKITRAMAETPAIESGKVWLPESAPWLPGLEGVLEAYPNSVTMDEVDSISQALMWFRTHPSVAIAPMAGAPLKGGYSR